MITLLIILVFIASIIAILLGIAVGAISLIWDLLTVVIPVIAVLALIDWVIKRNRES